MAELSKDKIRLQEKDLTKAKEEINNLSAIIKNQKLENQDLLVKNSAFNIKESLRSCSNCGNVVEKNSSRIKTDNLPHEFKEIINQKENDLVETFKNKENLIREEYTKQLSEVNKVLQEKIAYAEKLYLEMKILKTKNNSNNILPQEKEDEYLQKIAILETENQKLKLENKLNVEIIGQRESNNNANGNLTIKNNNLPDGKEFYNQDRFKVNACENILNINNVDSDKNALENAKNLNMSIQSNFTKHSQYFKNELIIIELKSEKNKLESLLDQKDKLIDALKDQIKHISNESFKKDFMLKNNCHDITNKDFTELMSKLQNLETEKINLLSENKNLKLSLSIAQEKIELLNLTITNKFESNEIDFNNSKAAKETLEIQISELTKVYKINMECLAEEANNMRSLIKRKDEEYDLMKKRYEIRIEQVKKRIF